MTTKRQHHARRCLFHAQKQLFCTLTKIMYEILARCFYLSYICTIIKNKKMKNATDNSILHASVLGTIAFNSGKKAIPVLDKEFMSLLEIPGIDTLLALNSWTAAWHSANLSKSV